MNRLIVKLNKSVARKYTDCKLIVVNDTIENTKSYDINKIIVASSSKFFELLFDKEPKSEYIINISFSLSTFDIFIKNLYGDDYSDDNYPDSDKNINCYIEELLMYTYFQTSNKKINKLLIRIIDYLEVQFYEQSDLIEFCTFFKFIDDHEILSINIANFRHRLGHIMEKAYPKNLNEGLTKKSFIENYIDEKSKKIVITRRRDDRYIFSKNEYSGLCFRVYSTSPREKYDNCHGFWVTAKPINENKDNCEVMTATIKLEILNGIDDPKTFEVRSFRDNNKFNFPPETLYLGGRDRYGEIINGEISMHSNTLFKFIIEFE